MGSKVGKILKSVAPIAAGFIPGIGPLAAAALGAGAGALTGGGLRGALSGGLGAYGVAGGAGLLGNAVNNNLGLGLASGGTGAGALGGALLGAGSGAASNGLKGALLGGATGGVGGYAGAGGFDGLGESLGITGPGSLLGEAASNYGQYGPTQTGATLSQPGSGFLGSATRSLSDIGSALGAGTGGGSSTYSGGGSGAGLGALLGGINSLNANDEAQEALLKAQGNSMGALQPYLQSGNAANNKLSSLLGLGNDGSMSDEILASDPGYKFQLEQGEQALGRQQAAKGNFFSGAALKAAQDYGQGLANQTVSDYYNKLAQQSGQGFQAANSAGNIFSGTGNAQAAAGISSANIMNQSLSSLLGGSGAYGLKRDQFGNPIYGAF